MGSLDSYKYKHLTPSQVSSFMTHGFLRLTDCFSPEKAADWTSTVWQRLDMDPNDKTTWTKGRINMPHHRTEPVSTFAPKAWNAICELLGGEDRIATESAIWNDGLIVNLGTPEWAGKEQNPKELTGWHVDGDFFVHYLDSREQGLLVIPVFTDIVEQAGGTMICSDGIDVIARHLYDHPEGVSIRMTPRGQANFPDGGGLEFYCNLVQDCKEFHEMTGKVGDVILLHPFMVHSASQNSLRIPRIITNPPVSLRAEFNYDRENPDDYSLVEQKTLQALGKDRLRGWRATGPRETVVPERLRVQNEMKKKELDRLNRLNEAQV